MSKDLDPQVPGAHENDRADDAGPVNADMAEVEMVNVPKAEYAALKQRIAAFESGKMRTSSANNDLPDQDDIDPTKLKTTVLTKQGWISPVAKR